MNVGVMMDEIRETLQKIVEILPLGLVILGVPAAIKVAMTLGNRLVDMMKKQLEESSYTPPVYEKPKRTEPQGWQDDHPIVWGEEKPKNFDPWEDEKPKRLVLNDDGEIEAWE